MRPTNEVVEDEALSAALRTARWLRRSLWLLLVLLPLLAWLSMQHDPYAVDGDAVAYMDLADLIRTHQWAGVVNAYWHPLYPAFLLVGQWLFHPSRATELSAYYAVNFLIFLMEAVAIIAFATAVCRLRDDGVDGGGPFRSPDGTRPGYLLPVNAVRLLGLALLVIASQRELSLGKVRPDALLQALLLFAVSAMLTVLRPQATGDAPGRAQGGVTPAWQLGAAALMGLALGFAYLTKSFAFLVSFLAVVTMAVAQVFWLRRRPMQVVLTAAVAALCFALVAGPYVVALSLQKHRLDFGDSGSLNYAWYVGGTQKDHLEPWQTGRFGSSTVHLLHPERQVMATPGVYSYAAQRYGTQPVWFDASFFNERIVTHMRPAQLLRRDTRNLVLVLRYLLNHPEAWLLLLLLLSLGARWRRQKEHFAPQSLVWLPFALGAVMWCIYGLVNIEERYVTAAYLLMVLPAFAALRRPADPGRHGLTPHAVSLASAACIVLLCALALGETARVAAELRREQSLRGIARGWQDSPMFAVAQGLAPLRLAPGTAIACVGTIACLNDPYWMRLAQVRTTTEVAMDHDHVAATLGALPNRAAVYDALRAEGSAVLVGHFDPAALLTSPLAGEGWQRLGTTGFYALPLQRGGASAGIAVPATNTPAQETAR